MSVFREAAAAATIVAIGIVWIGPKAWDALDSHEVISTQVKNTVVGSVELVRHPVASAGIVMRGVLHDTRAVIADGKHRYDGTKQAGNDSPTRFVDILGRLTISYVATLGSDNTSMPNHSSLLDRIPSSVMTI